MILQVIPSGFGCSLAQRGAEPGSTGMRSHHGQKSKAWWLDAAPLGAGISTPKSPRCPQAPPGPHPKSLPSAEAKERGRTSEGDR